MPREQGYGGGQLFGGSGRTIDNLVTLYQNPTNRSMETVEVRLRDDIITRCETVLYEVRPSYGVGGPRFHPESPGLFPWAVSGNGDHCYWLVERGVADDETPIVVKQTRGGEAAVWRFPGASCRLHSRLPIDDGRCHRDAPDAGLRADP